MGRSTRLTTAVGGSPIPMMRPGNRITKTAGGVTSVYVRDVQGNILSIYNQTGSGSPVQQEVDLYGSSRLGSVRALTVAPATVTLGGIYGVATTSTFTRGEKSYELTNHLGNVLSTVTDKKIAVVSGSNSSLIDHFTADIATAQDYYPFGMLMPGRTYTASTATNYRFGFNGKENDNEVKGVGDQIDYGMRYYDPRAGRFLSVDPIAGKFPFYSPYEYGGNSPIRFIDLDGAETYDNSAKYWGGQPLINMASAPARGVNAAGVPRNAIWFFKQQLAAKPEMFSEANKISIKNRINPIVDEQWIRYNPSAAGYELQTLVHHHIEGGELAAAIPERMHYDKFSELHPYVNQGKSLRGTKVSGTLGGTLTVLGNISMLTGLFTGDPDSWVNSFGFGEPHVGEIRKDWGNTDLYVQIMTIRDHYVPVFDGSGKPVIDEKTGQPKYRLGSKTVEANIYSGYIWDNDTGRYQGVNKVGSKSEEWLYDENGKRVQAKTVSNDSQPAQL